MDRAKEFVDNLGNILSGHSALIVKRANELSYLVFIVMAIVRGGDHPAATIIIASIVLVLTQVFNFYTATYSNNVLQDYRAGKMTDEELAVAYKEKRKPGIILVNVIAAVSLVNLLTFVTNVIL